MTSDHNVQLFDFQPQTMRTVTAVTLTLSSAREVTQRQDFLGTKHEVGDEGEVSSDDGFPGGKSWGGERLGGGLDVSGMR